MKHFLVLVCCLAFFVVGSQAKATTISKEDWITTMQTLIAENLCQKKGYFLSCWKISQKECKGTISDVVESCSKKIKKMPEEFDMDSEEGNEFANKVGTCTGLAFVTEYADRSITSKKCSSSKNFP